MYVLSSVAGVKDKRRTVAYAEGYDPANYSDTGERLDACVDAGGGEDFAKSLPFSSELLTAIAGGKHDLQIVVMKTHFRID
ncbi:DUF3085 domain-containing protein [Pantoea agglomerans]|nr:DUF3085 domain-containing protein [Pantoea agglomerans]